MYYFFGTQCSISGEELVETVWYYIHHNKKCDRQKWQSPYQSLCTAT